MFFATGFQTRGRSRVVPDKDGDYINLDLTCFKNGFFGDNSLMVTRGDVPEEIAHLVGQLLMEISVCRQSMYAGIEQARVGSKISEIGREIERVATLGARD